MISAIIAAIIGGSLYLSLGGTLWATQILIGLIVINISLVLLSVATVIGFQKTMLMKSEKRLAELKENSDRIDVGTVLLLRILILFGVWHIYTLGYIFFAGIAATTVCLSIVIMLLQKLESSTKETQDE